MSSKRILVLASRNRGKLNELRALLDERVDIRTLDDYPNAVETVEDGETFQANALKKARDVVAHTGEIALSDDSGLEVDALGGAPGVLSARFAGPSATDAANNAKLLEQLRDVPESKRTARFRCVLALVTPEGSEQTVEAAWKGVMLREERGDNGFGYDPLFFSPPQGKTSAELTREEKNRVSHRGQALVKARALIEALLEA